MASGIRRCRFVALGWTARRTLSTFANQMRLFLFLAFCLLVPSWAYAAAEPLPRNVLVLDEPDPSSGNSTVFSVTLRETLNTSTPRVAIFGETLNLSRFSGPNQEAILRTYFKQKYSDVDFGVVLAVGASAFDLVRRWRSELWPHVPVVFAAIDEMTAADFKLDTETTGLIMRRTMKSMIAAARVLVPDLQGIAVLGGSLEKDPYRLQYRSELPALATEIQLTNLTGLPLAAQLKRASALPEKTAILYTSLFIDDEGTRYSSPDALAEIAKVANRPIVTDVENLVGAGATGGFALNNVAYGKEVAALALRVLDGASIAENPVRVSEPIRPVFDWRQLQRWGISTSALPPGSEIRFRPTGLWDQYRSQILLISAAILVQTVLILWLIYEHRRRNVAEVQSRNSMAELTYMNRKAAAGELSASIAHEVNQPLTGISTRASAALRWLRTDKPDLQKVKAALEHIVIASHRAADVVAGVRAMFKKDSTQRVPTDVNELILVVLSIVRIELENNRVDVQAALDERLPIVLGDKVQLQQVVLNLVMNAIDAMKSIQPRMLRVKTQADAGKIIVSVEDNGTGIDPSKLDQLFQPLFTTKANGMGMGLAICRSVIESHEGRIWATPAAGRGSVFQFELPEKPGETRL
jgi:signal transduction histidine kinase